VPHPFRSRRWRDPSTWRDEMRTAHVLASCLAAGALLAGCAADSMPKRGEEIGESTAAVTNVAAPDISLLTETATGISVSWTSTDAATTSFIMYRMDREEGFFQRGAAVPANRPAGSTYSF